MVIAKIYIYSYKAGVASATGRSTVAYLYRSALVALYTETLYPLAINTISIVFALIKFFYILRIT